MKKIIILLSCAFLLVGCQNNEPEVTPTVTPTVTPEGVEPTPGVESELSPLATVVDTIRSNHESFSHQHQLLVEPQLLEGAYGINDEKREMMKDFVIFAPMMNTKSNEIIVIDAIDGNQEALKELILTRQSVIQSNFETYLPDQLEIAKNYVLVEDETLLIFVIDENAKAIADEILVGLKGK